MRGGRGGGGGGGGSAMEMFIVYSSITSSGKINFQHVSAFMVKGGKWILGDSLRPHLINVTHSPLSLSLSSSAVT